MRKIINSLFYFLLFTPFFALAEFTVSDPPDGLFDKASKVAQGFMTAGWAVKMSAGIFTMFCFISAGNYARRGDVGLTIGAVIGGILAVLGAYFVTAVQ